MSTLDRDECASNKANKQLDRAIVNGIQEKLFRLEVNYAKRLKVQEICYKKKFDDLQRKFKELSVDMDVSGNCTLSVVDMKKMHSLSVFFQKMYFFCFFCSSTAVPK